MYIDQKGNGVIAKVGKVSVEIYRNSYRLRWRYNSKRYVLTISGNLSKEALKAATAKANIINGDMALDKFDESLVKYDPTKAQALISIPTELNLYELWERYKAANKHRVEKTTQNNSWKQTDKCLTKVSHNALKLCNAPSLVQELLEHYHKSTLERIGTNITACLNWSHKQQLIDRVPDYGFKFNLPKSERSKKTFTPDEIHRIILAFETDEFKSPKSTYSHSYYTGFITCLALTGRRPEDVIALTHNDLIDHYGKCVIKFSKAYSKGVLKSTKNNRITLYPVNGQLSRCFTKQGKIDNPNNLIFPSHNGGYIDLHNFLNRYWKPVLTQLVDMGVIREYLPLYNLRHSRATNLIRAGIDLESVAALLETSIPMLSKHYLEDDTGINLPDL
jgi:integrase